MIRRAAALAWLIATAAVAQPLAESWAHWRWWRPITPSPTESPRLVTARLPPAVHGRAAADLRGLRVIDTAGVEVAFILHARTGRRTREWLEQALTEVSHVPGSYTRALVDLGAAGSRHNRVELLVDDPEPEIFARVDVAVRDGDRGAWHVLAEGRPVHRFAGRPAELTVSYGATRARWLRLRIRPEAGRGPERFPLRGVRVAHAVDEPPERRQLAAGAVLDDEAPPGESWWELDAGWTGVPASQVRFRVAAPEVDRRVEVYRSTDGERWTLSGKGRLRRTAESGDDPAEEETTPHGLDVEFSEARARYWRVVIYDGDDPPLPAPEISLWGVPRYVVFRQQPATQYRLLYGNERAAEPRYELARLTARDEIEAAAPSELGGERENATWVDPRPWTERHRWVMWAALGLAIVTLGGLALRSLRTADREPAD